jgi:hypothetical protein
VRLEGEARSFAMSCCQSIEIVDSVIVS